MRLSGITLLSMVISLGYAFEPKDYIEPAKYNSFTKVIKESTYMEQFEEYMIPNVPETDWKRYWKQSAALTNEGDLKYQGGWNIQVPEMELLVGNKGLVALDDAKLHGIATILPRLLKPFDETDTLVFQYEVKFQKGLDCGGAYVKLLLSDDKDNKKVKVKGIDDASEFNDETPYVIMFGPDKCGENNRVHLILKDENDNEHHLKNPPLARTNNLTNLYTLILKRDGAFEVRINGDVERAGNIYDSKDFDYSSEEENQTPKFIDDPNDSKPEDWDDDEFVPDLNVQKPENWDDSAPYLILDPNAEIPDDWEVDTPEQIPDPNVRKPDHWDDDEDGEFIAPLIDNPECLKHGCGEWIHPYVKNPNYNGKWTQPTIPNPNYMGTWSPKQILNPDYKTSQSGGNGDELKLANIAGIGFDLWTMNGGILFDDIYLGHYIDEAEDFANYTFVKKEEVERDFLERLSIAAKEEYEREAGKRENESILSSFNLERLSQLSILQIINELIAIIELAINDFIVELQMYIGDLVIEPIETILQRPGEAVWFSSIILGTIGSIMAFWSMTVTIIKGSFDSASTNAVESKKKTKRQERSENFAKSSSTKANATKAKKRA